MTDAGHKPPNYEAHPVIQASERFGPKGVKGLGDTQEGLMGGGGGGGGIETRIAVLEVEMRGARDDLTAIKTDMRDVRERLVKVEATMATKGFIVVAVTTLFVLLTGLNIFQARIQQWANPPAPTAPAAPSTTSP